MEGQLSDNEVKKLIKIVNGGLIFQGSCLTLGLKVPVRRHNLMERLVAIQDLGESRNKLALKYLYKLTRFKDYFVTSVSGDESTDSGKRDYVFAKGELRDELKSKWKGEPVKYDTDMRRSGCAIDYKWGHLTRENCVPKIPRNFKGKYGKIPAQGVVDILLYSIERIRSDLSDLAV